MDSQKITNKLNRQEKKELKEKVIHYFKNVPDNSSPDIANHFNISVSFVNSIINSYFNYLKKNNQS